MTIAERLGSFYLGKEYDLAAAKLGDVPVMYDARDLTTHAVCVGMTGSGKTGLCIDLLEEAALDKVPAIIIDPKGDITNLLLTFPDLLPENFLPWINADDARRKDMTPEAYAAKQAETWRAGLADWGQGTERIKLLKESVDFVIYTPGSDSGIPVSILSSFAAPQLNWDDEQEALRERISGTVSALLGLIGVEADPVRSREHILLSNIFEHAWRNGESLDLAKLIMAIQNPPVRQLGVFDVDTFFPEKDRFGLAMALNNIIAAPSFSSWIQGTPLDIDHMLYGGDAKPNVSIFYIAHLSDAERMFFVTLLLEQVITWMRAQPGTTSLRALLYMDEVFGYFPPGREPASKRPMLTLMKQARAFGLGVMLTTQNPVDLDYKGLTNAGTWFIGKLQADRDKQRLLDGLEGLPSAGSSRPDRQQLDKIISGLGSRVFMLHNVNQDQPIIYQTRWAMSYLRGPLTRSQVKELMADKRAELLGTPTAQPGATRPAAVSASPAQPAMAAPAQPAAIAAGMAAAIAAAPPMLPSGVAVVYLPASRSLHQALGDLESKLGMRVNAQESQLRYEARLLGQATITFFDEKKGLDEHQEVAMLLQPPGGAGIVRWDQALPLTIEDRDFLNAAEPNAVFGSVPESANAAKKLSALSGDFADYLFRNSGYSLFSNPALKAFSKPGEDERAFKIRCQQIAREQRDAEVDKLEAKYQTQIDRLQEKLRKEKTELEQDKADHSARKQQEALSAGDSILGMFLGKRRSLGGSLSKASSRRQMTERAKLDIEESEAEIEKLNQEIAEIEQALQEASAEATERWNAAVEQVEQFQVRPRKSDVKVRQMAVAWTPNWQVTYSDAGGAARTEILSAI
jgi:hypothetical protein